MNAVPNFIKISIIILLTNTIGYLTGYGQYSVRPKTDSLTLFTYNYNNYNNINNENQWLHTESPEPKRFWRASGELILVELLPWAYNYFVRDAEFAHITWASIGHNLKLSSWTWDDNKFQTNQFAHPYHGNLYFNAFRSNGYSFWQAVPAAFAGSYIWETFGETHPPAINDFINTSLGGIALGEMTHRLANRVINEHRRGFGRQMDEVVGFIIDPLNGFNRAVDGKWGKYKPGTREDDNLTDFTGEIDGGARWITRNSEVGPYARLLLNYGGPIQNIDHPFDSFAVEAEIGRGGLNILRVNGLLYGFDMKSNESTTNVGAISLDYNYYNDPAIYYGGQHIDFNYLSEHKLSDHLKLLTDIGGGAVVLAAVHDPYLNYGEGRTYDYTSGLSLLGGAVLQIDSKWRFDVDYRGSWTVTLNGYESTHFLNAIRGGVKYSLSKNLVTGFEAGRFNLNGNYANYPDVSSSYPYVRILFGYKFKI
ncbi:MAG TPA: DUF3943 domain-containing protein [Mucilaginibacter sp.]|jgi:hypothetical protein